MYNKDKQKYNIDQESLMKKINSSKISDRDLEKIDAYWRAANYLSVGQIYLLDNIPCLKSR